MNTFPVHCDWSLAHTSTGDGICSGSILERKPTPELVNIRVFKTHLQTPVPLYDFPDVCGGRGIWPEGGFMDADVDENRLGERATVDLAYWAGDGWRK